MQKKTAKYPLTALLAVGGVVMNFFIFIFGKTSLPTALLAVGRGDLQKNLQIPPYNNSQSHYRKACAMSAGMCLARDVACHVGTRQWARGLRLGHNTAHGTCWA